jgi:hypothetical protein
MRDAREQGVRQVRVQYIIFRNTVQVQSIAQAKLHHYILNQICNHTINSPIAVHQGTW